MLGDWANPYKTMDFANEAGEIRALAEMVKQGFVFKGLKPVNWCFDCASALAEAEVEYQDKKSDAIDVGFVCEDSDKLAAAFGLASLDKPASIVIWTTTPWTIPANQALNVHPEFDYALVDTGDQLLLLAEELVESCLQRYALQGAVLATAKGQALELIRFRHPFYERFAPVYLADYVALDAGTGIVHSAPAYGEDDFRSCKGYGMSNDEILSPVQSNGVYVESLPFFGGQFIWKANPNIVEKLAEVGALLKHEAIQHSYMHCWRHKTPMIYRATAQWFVGMDKVIGDGSSLRRRALDAVEQTQFVPAWGQARLQGMIAGRPDWCISRQRNWGVPIPFFLHKESGELHPRTTELMEAVAQRVEQQGIEAWFKLDAAELLGDEAAQYDKISDTLDVWFDSGTTHWHVLRGSHPLGHPSLATAKSGANKAVLLARDGADTVYVHHPICQLLRAFPFQSRRRVIELAELFDIGHVIPVAAVRVAHIGLAAGIQVGRLDRVLGAAEPAAGSIAGVVAGAVEEHADAQGDAHFGGGGRGLFAVFFVLGPALFMNILRDVSLQFRIPLCPGLVGQGRSANMRHQVVTGFCPVACSAHSLIPCVFLGAWRVAAKAETLP